MTKVLVYGNRKSDDILIDASTPEKEAAAFLKLFNYLDNEWQCYSDMDGKQKILYGKAKAGDASAAFRLLSQRKSYEYEEWHIADLIDPFTENL
jgi:hypothetical protein